MKSSKYMIWLNKIINKNKGKDVIQRRNISLEETANMVIKSTGTQIKNGLEKKSAGTGTPINKLNGAAKTLAQLSNIGGGSKSTGGGGIEKGMEIMGKFIQAKTVKQTIKRIKK